MNSSGVGPMPLSSALSSAHQAVVNARLNSLTQEHKFAKKCKHLKRMMKDLLWENSILFNHLQRGITETNICNEERRRLTRKLIGKINKHVIPLRKPLPSCITISTTGSHKIQFPSGAARTLTGLPERPKESISVSTAAQAKGRKKAHSDKRYVQPIPLDNTGRPIFPIELPGIEVHCLGEIDNKRPAYHTEDLLYPVGFCSSREFAASSDPTQTTLYTCTVNDNGTEPKFEMSGEDTLTVFKGRTPDECVASLIAAINETLPPARHLPSLPPNKGAEFFGLSIPTIHHLIQGCLGTRRCLRYKPVRYETSRLPPPASASTLLDVHLSYTAFREKCLK
ncbi:transforming growth factor beta regulator 1 [Galendromus occidentalis]|uniref:Transforming growth factor beta regulator 1 n=1 Tax=Galendromus occidentalis TaxID=34638 RepID=A0AAJ6QNH7_9ACAR|nr:transforming growth factor beta regulator 1 [Galendromus occidentalis]